MAISYIYPETGEAVEKERWRWVAVYKDGSILEQFEVRPGVATFHRFAEIDTANLEKFLMIHDSLPKMVVRLPEGAKLVHAYVTAVHQYKPDRMSENVVTDKFKGYKFGYQLDGKDYGVLIDHDDTVQVLSDFGSAIVAYDRMQAHSKEAEEELA